MIYSVDNTNIEEMVNERAYKRYRSYMMRNIALLESEGGKHCRGNARAIYDELCRQETSLKLIWIIKDNNDEVPEGAHTVKKYSKKYWKLLATAKFIITDTQQNRMYRKRKQQRLVQLSHGTPMSESGVYVEANGEYEKREKIVDILEDCRRWSFLAVSSKIAHENYKESYTHRQKVLKFGQPEHDKTFRKGNYDEILEIRRTLELKYGERLILLKFRNKNEADTLKKVLEHNHSNYRCVEYSEIEDKVTFIDAALASEILITDNYDQVIAYSLTKNPIIFYKFDESIEYYEDLSKYFPGGKVNTIEEMEIIAEKLKHYQDLYRPHMENFNARFNEYEKGNSAQKIIETVKIGVKRSQELALFTIDRENATKIEKFIDRQYLKALAYIERQNLDFADKLIKKTQLLIPTSNDIIVFESFLGRNYSDNPKAIYEELLKSNNNLKCVWALEDTDVEEDMIPGNSIIVRRLSPKYFYYLARARFIVSNSRLTRKFEKKEDQIYIQTWHGTPLKKLVLDMENVTLPGTNKQNYYINFLKEAQRWDYLISANKYSTEKFKSAFSQENILEIGYPRNDILANHTQADVERSREKFGLFPEDKVLLYAPTFRDNASDTPGEYNQQIKLDLEQLAIKCPEWKILLRTHYLVTQDLDIKRHNVIDVSTYDDVNDLYLASDAIMTDYSSVFFDFAILDRPMIFYAYDIREYEGELRGFYLDYHTLPGENIDGTDDLIEILNDIETYKMTYQPEMDKFRKTYNELEKGTASKYIVDTILSQKFE